MPPARSLLGGLLGAVALLLLLIGTHSQMHTQVDIFDDTCDAQLQGLWNSYTSPPVAPVAGCNTTCLAACYTTLNLAIYSERKQNCPLQADIIHCMHVSVCVGLGAASVGQEPRGWCLRLELYDIG
jgi:hypothetical protein